MPNESPAILPTTWELAAQGWVPSELRESASEPWMLLSSLAQRLWLEQEWWMGGLEGSSAQALREPEVTLQKLLLCGLEGLLCW